MQRDFATGHISRAALISALRLGVQSGSAVFFVFFWGGRLFWDPMGILEALWIGLGLRVLVPYTIRNQC